MIFTNFLIQTIYKLPFLHLLGTNKQAGRQDTYICLRNIKRDTNNGSDYIGDLKLVKYDDSKVSLTSVQSKWLTYSKEKNKFTSTRGNREYKKQTEPIPYSRLSRIILCDQPCICTLYNYILHTCIDKCSL